MCCAACSRCATASRCCAWRATRSRTSRRSAGGCSGGFPRWTPPCGWWRGHGRDGLTTEANGMAKDKRSSAAGPKAEQKRAAEEREKGSAASRDGSHGGSRFLKGQRIEPKRIDGTETAAELIEHTFLAYNAARL